MASEPRRPARDDAPRTSRQWLVDAVLAVGVAAVVALVISANLGGRQPPDAIAYLWAVGLGALMFARRRWPRLVLAITVLGLFAYYAAGYPAVGVAVPVAAAVFSAAEMGRLRSAIVASAVVVAVSVGFRLVEGQDFSLVVSYELAGHVLLLAGAVALGDSVRSRRELAVSARRLVAATAEEERQRALSAAHEARVAIARDLHDNVGHAITVISLHTDVASEAIGRDDDAARDALGVVKATTQSVMSELRATVRRLREPGARPDGTRTIRDIETRLLPGVPIDVDARIQPPAGIAPDVEDAAFRIVQEALTNVARHAAATRVRVEVVGREGLLHVTVVDDGGRASRENAADATESGGAAERRGLGIPGMRERATAVGGTFEAGHEHTGFAVRAVLPLEGRP